MPRQRKWLAGRVFPFWRREADVDLAKILTGAASAAVVILLLPATVPARGTQDTNVPKMAVLHATITITGGLTFTGAYDDRLTVGTCADIAKGGTHGPDSDGDAMFYVPVPLDNTGGDGGPVGGGHTFTTDVAASPYHGPGTYTGSGLTATQMDVDTPPGSQDTHIFAFPTAVGTMIVNPDASGSFQFEGLQDPGSVTISGKVTWTCS